MKVFGIVFVLGFFSFASAQQQLWGQCGGIGWTGPTTCVAGSFCNAYSEYYSQCIPGATTTTAAPPPPGTTTTSSPQPGGTGLNSAARAAGKLYFGTAVDGPSLNDQPYQAILRNTADFGQITHANALKWDATEPSRNQFNFNNANQIVNIARTNGQQLRGHTCVWYSQLPSWVSNGGFDSATLTQIIQNHCSTIIRQYAGQIYSWDVVNEALNEDGSLRSNVFYNTLGTNYIGIAFNSARSADPSTKLYINDYNIEGSGSKSTGIINLVRQQKNAGVPIDGIGMQAHLIVGSVPSNIASTIQQYASLGVEVAITELDIRMTLPVTDQKLQQQRQDYQNVIAACRSQAACVGVTIWDFTDKYSWVPNTFSGQGAALPWDENYNKKPAYDGILAGWRG